MGAVCCGGRSSDAGEKGASQSQETAREAQYEPTQNQRLEFGYQKNFSECYSLGSELGRGQYGTTFVYAFTFHMQADHSCKHRNHLRPVCIR
jgi:flagellar biosynthesis/type III secretory pathway protein FliH